MLRCAAAASGRSKRRIAKELLLWLLVVGGPLGIACMGDPSSLVVFSETAGDTPAEATAEVSGTADPMSPPLADSILCSLKNRRDTAAGRMICDDGDGPVGVEPATDPTDVAALEGATNPLAAGTTRSHWQTSYDLNISAPEPAACEVEIRVEAAVIPAANVSVTCGTATDTADGTLDAGSSLPALDPGAETANPVGATLPADHAAEVAGVVSSGFSLVSDHWIESRETCTDGTNGYEVVVLYKDTFGNELLYTTFSTCDGRGTGDVGASTPVAILGPSDSIAGCGNPTDISVFAGAGNHVFAVVGCSDDFQSRLVGARLPDGDPGSATFEVILEPDDEPEGYQVFGVGFDLDAAASGDKVVVVNGDINADDPGNSAAFISVAFESGIDEQSYTLAEVIGSGSPSGYNADRSIRPIVVPSGPAAQVPGDPLEPAAAPLVVYWLANDSLFSQPDQLYRLVLDGSSSPELLADDATVLPGAPGEFIDQIFTVRGDNEAVAIRIRTDLARFGNLRLEPPTPTSPTLVVDPPTFQGDPAPGGGNWQTTGTPYASGDGEYFSGRIDFNSPGGARDVLAYKPSDGGPVWILQSASEIVQPFDSAVQTPSLPSIGAVIGDGPRAPGGALLTNTTWGGSGPPLAVLRLDVGWRPRQGLLGARVDNVASDAVFRVDAPDYARTNLASPGVLAIESYAQHPTTGDVYAGTGASDGGRLHAVDPGTGALTLVGNLAGVFACYGLAFDGAGQLFGVVSVANNDERWLAQIDHTTAGVTLVDRIEHPGGTAALRLQAATFLPDGRLLSGAGFQFGATNTPLVEVDTTTAEVVTVVEIEDQYTELQGLDVSADGVLVGSFQDGSVYELDPDDGGQRLIAFVNTAGVAAIHVIDSDADGRRDDQEIADGTRPHDPDSDNDGLDDAAEAAAGTDPLDPDTDGDGLRDGFEVKYGLNPLVIDATGADGDGDGLDLLEEQQYGGDPGAADTDGDGTNDGIEVLNGTHVFAADSDGDGADDTAEAGLGTDPLDPDSDDDGIADASELLSYPADGGGTTALDPLDPDSDGDGLLDGDDPEPGIPAPAPPPVPALPGAALPLLAVLLGAVAAVRLRRAR